MEKDREKLLIKCGRGRERGRVLRVRQPGQQPQDRKMPEMPEKRKRNKIILNLIQVLRGGKVDFDKVEVFFSILKLRSTFFIS